jgi:hypothetical protein
MMSLRYVAAQLLAAFVIGLAIWGMLGPPPSEGRSVIANNRRFAGPPRLEDQLRSAQARGIMGDAD